VKGLPIEPGDRLVVSARAIPGNEVAISRMLDMAERLGAETSLEGLGPVHASGHGSRDELADLIRAVGQAPTIVVGCSMGGMTALLFAIEFPNFTRRLLAMATTNGAQAIGANPFAFAFTPGDALAGLVAVEGSTLTSALTRDTSPALLAINTRSVMQNA
jgi:pimeloyl-ACP methyl ester carboxylesterase